MPFEPVETRRLYRRIADQLAQLIASGELPPASRLPAERDLARRLNVSRPSLREALIALEIEGLIDIRGGSGITVRRSPLPPTPHVLDSPGPFEILQARLVVEPECAALAARSGSAAARAAVASAFDRLAAEIAKGRPGIDLDEGFHLAIGAASGNAALARIVGTLWRDQAGPIAVRLGEIAGSPARLRANLAEHAAIAAAIAAGDAARARSAMRRHLAAVRAIRLATLGPEPKATAGRRGGTTRGDNPEHGAAQARRLPPTPRPR